MVLQLPLQAMPIGVEWITIEGGFGIAASTDARGEALMGLYKINRMGQPCGLPILFPRDRLMMDIVLGLEDGIVMPLFFDAHITKYGVEVTICPPLHIKQRGVSRFQSSVWGSNPPERNFYAWLFPNDNHNDNECASYCLSKSA